MLATKRMGYYCNCVGWPESDVHTEGGLIDMIHEAKDISRSTFLKHVDRDELDELAKELSYSTRRDGGLMMCNDWHISYHRSKLHGKTVYFFKHSAIEYVFTTT